MTLYNNFLLKRGVGLFSRVGLFSGDYGNYRATMGHIGLITEGYGRCE